MITSGLIVAAAIMALFFYGLIWCIFSCAQTYYSTGDKIAVGVMGGTVLASGWLMSVFIWLLATGPQ